MASAAAAAAAAATAGGASDTEAIAASAAVANEEEQLAILETFAALDADGSGTLSLGEFVSAARRMGLGDEEWADARLQADLETALPSLKAASGDVGGGSSLSGDKRGGGVTLAEIAAWWRSSDASGCQAALKKRLFDKYAATHDKLGKATGVAFG
jgi:hypothetical protein